MAEPYLLGPYAIRPHPKAPLFDDPESASKAFSKILEEVSKGSGDLGKEAFSLIRQASYVSLWFFLRFVLGHSGPYDRLDDAVSVDMCNVRQSDAWEAPGAMAAAFIPRSFYKSTVFTHGGATWDLLRDPDERIVIVNAIYDKAVEFLKVIEANFTNNPLFRYLFPEYCAFTSKAGQVSDKALVLPNRTKSNVEPSVKPLGVSGAAEGGHFTRIALDDLVGLDSLGQDRGANANMEVAKKWMGTNLSALRDGRASKVGLVATRYAIDDCYQRVYDGCRSVTGWTKGDLQPKAGGQWDVYWRLVEEDGVYLRPDVMDKEGLDELVREDFWAAMTQWYNSPFKAGLAEFSGLEPRRCVLAFKGGEWVIERPSDNFSEALPDLRLADCDVVMSIDPAATDRGISAKTCRTSVGVWATDSDDNKYRVASRVGFFSQHQTVDAVFELHRTLNGCVNRTIVEVNAYQKVLKEYLDREQEERGVWLHCVGVNARGDKKARIRVCFGTYLVKGKIFADVRSDRELREELRLFPMSESRLDVLDESEKGIVYGRRPDSPEDRERRRLREWERAEEGARESAFGY